MDDELIWATGKAVQGFGPPPGMDKKKKEEAPASSDEKPSSPLPFDDEDFPDFGM
ncbi:hypothetical protein D3C73_1663920 [compost metagenome]